MIRQSFTAITVVCVVFCLYPILRAQQEIDTTCFDSILPATLISGEEIIIELTSDTPLITGKGHSKIFRYGAISSGPVELKLSGEGLNWYGIVLDAKGILIAETTGGGKGQTRSMTLDMAAGQSIRIIVGGLSPEGNGTLKVLLLEAHLPEGENNVSDAIGVARKLYSQSVAELKSRNLIKSRESVRLAFKALDCKPGCRQSKRAMDLFQKIGLHAYKVQEFETASYSLARLDRFLQETRLPDDREFLQIRMYLGVSLFSNLKYKEARPFLEQVHRMLDQKGPTDSPLLQQARVNYGLVLNSLGEPQKARSLLEKALIVYEQTLSSDDFNLQAVRVNLASILIELDDYQRARELLTCALGIYELTLPPENPDLQKVRMDLGIVLKKLGEVHQALPLLEKVLEIYLKILPPESFLLQKARFNLANLLCDLGDLYGAKELYDEILKVYIPRLDPRHPELNKIRMSLAGTIHALGDPNGARVLFETALKSFEDAYPEDHPTLQMSKMNLAAILYELGEYQDAKDLLEQVVDNYTRNQSPDYPLLQTARSNLALVLLELKDLEKARKLLEKVMAVYRDTISHDHVDFQTARLNLALILWELGELTEAKELLEVFKNDCERLLPSDHPDLQIAYLNLANLLRVIGLVKDAVALTKNAVKCAHNFISRRIQTGSIRTIDESISKCRFTIDNILSLGCEGLISPCECFEVSEIYRAAGARTGKMLKFIASNGGEEIKNLQKDLLNANTHVASADPEDLFSAVRKRDEIEKKLTEAVRKLPGADSAIPSISIKKITANLPHGWAGISFQRFTKHRISKDGKRIESIPYYLAFLVHKDKDIDFICLGNAIKIDESVKLWRNALVQTDSLSLSSNKYHEEALKLIKLLWDPIRRKLNNIKNVVVAIDSVLALIPLDALPFKNGYIADEYTISYIDSLSSLCIAVESNHNIAPCLIAFGDIDYNNSPDAYDDNNSTSVNPYNESKPIAFDSSSAPRSSKSTLVRPLPYSGDEVKMVSHLFKEKMGIDPILISGTLASKKSLISLSSRATYLHIATHGYYAPEYFQSSYNNDNFINISYYSTSKEKIRSLAPSLLCGLRLAGCNQPRTGLEDYGVITAEEIQGLDLSNCKLAVLSACETNVGMLRLGQGIMSMQRAIGIAGARGSITSLWQVDDKASRFLFDRFYHYLLEDNLSPPVALRKTKIWLRDLSNNDLVKWDRDHISRGLLNNSNNNRFNKSSKPFNSSFFWAPFVYWGSVK